MSQNLPKVSIVVTAYLEKSKPYLDLCIDSIKNLNYPGEIETILVTPTWYVPKYENVKTVHPCYGSYHNPVAVNYGFAQADKESKYIVLINDDVIMTKNCLKNMVQVAGDSDVVLGCISNCDNFGHYQLVFPCNLDQRQYRLDQLDSNVVNEMKNFDSFYPSGVIFPNTLYLYCNLFPRKVWEKVKNGTTKDSIGFDENYRTSYDDTDWMMRAQSMNIRAAICLDALSFHMSGVSADVTQGPLDSDVRQESMNYFRKKWNL